jgi:hypothetical protein
MEFKIVPAIGSQNCQKYAVHYFERRNSLLSEPQEV